MFINEIGGTKREGPSYILEDITSILVDVMSEPTDFKTLTLVEFLKVREEDGFCQQAHKQAFLSGRELSLNKDGMIIRRTTMDGAVQKNVS